MVTICPAYDGSVRTSWYPVMQVLNTTSPPVSPGAPAPSPSYQTPFSSARVAFIMCFARVGPFAVHSWLVLEGTGHARGFSGGHARGGDPGFLSGQFDPDDVRADRHVRQGQRRATDAPPIEQHGGPARERIHIQRPREGGRRRGRATARGCRAARRRLF